MPNNVAIRGDTKGAPPTARARSTAFYLPMRVPLIVRTRDEVDIFDEFYFRTLSFGVRPFIWAGWVRKGSNVFRFDLEADPPEAEELGGGAHLIPLNLVQYPDGAG